MSNVELLSRRLAGSIRSVVRRRSAGILASVVALLCILGVVVLQARLTNTDAEFLVRPVQLDPAGTLVAVRLTERVIHPGSSLRVTLFVRGNAPASIPLNIVPATFNATPQPAPDLSVRAISASGFKQRTEVLTPPPYVRTSPGSYALRVRGSATTFAVFGMEGHH